MPGWDEYRLAGDEFPCQVNLFRTRLSAGLPDDGSKSGVTQLDGVSSGEEEKLGVPTQGSKVRDPYLKFVKDRIDGAANVGVKGQQVVDLNPLVPGKQTGDGTRTDFSGLTVAVGIAPVAISEVQLTARVAIQELGQGLGLKSAGPVKIMSKHLRLGERFQRQFRDEFQRNDAG